MTSKLILGIQIIGKPYALHYNICYSLTFTKANVKKSWLRVYLPLSKKLNVENDANGVGCCKRFVSRYERCTTVRHAGMLSWSKVKFDPAVFSFWIVS